MAMRTWRCKEDAVKDLIRLNNFGEVDENDLRDALTERPKESPEQAAKFIDPRTGEEINELPESSLVIKPNSFGRGRGRIIEEFLKFKELKKQLRTAQPYCLGNEELEHYFNNHPTSNDELKKTAPKDVGAKTGQCGDDCRYDDIESNDQNESRSKSEKRKSKNVLMSGLLERLNANSVCETVNSSNQINHE